MAYNHYDDRRDRSSDYNRSDRGGGRQDERGFFERAGDEIASWFGDDDAERRRRDDERMNRDRDMNRDYDRGNSWGQGRDYDRGYGRDYGSTNPRSSREYDRMGYGGQDRDYSSRSRIGDRQNRDYMSPAGPSFGYGGRYGTGTDSGYGSGGYGSEYRGSEYNRDRSQDRERDRNSDRERSRDYRDYGRSQSAWVRDEYRNTGYAGSGRDNDRHYQSWRQRQMDELDTDYDRYNRERQDKFENDFGSWRQNRMGKRQNLGQIREHMDVVGSDGETVGKVDCVKGDHIVLTKSDSPDNRHHKIDCSMIEMIEGDQVRLDMPAEEAKSRWEDADNRGFFGRDDDRSRERSGPNHEANLNRSFSGTYDNES